MSQTGTAVRRHQPSGRGEIRREKMLVALENLLAERPLAEIAVADITTAGGVTRSAFYFYFPSKEAAAGALLWSVYDEFAAAEAMLVAGGEDPVAGLRSGLREVVRVWRKHERAIVATLDAAGLDNEVRATWDGWVQAFAGLVANRIELDRDRGVAVAGPPADLLADMLVGMNARTFERLSRTSSWAREPDVLRSLVHVWATSIYGVSR